MIVKLLTEHHLEVLSLKGGCRGSFKFTLVKLLEISCRGSYDTFQQENNKGADQTARMRRLVCACVSRKPQKTGFLMSRSV